MSTTAADGGPIHMPDHRHKLLSLHAIGQRTDSPILINRALSGEHSVNASARFRAVRYCFRSQIRSHRRRAFLATTLLLICVM